MKVIKYIPLAINLACLIFNLILVLLSHRFAEALSEQFYESSQSIFGNLIFLLVVSSLLILFIKGNLKLKGITIAIGLLAVFLYFTTYNQFFNPY